MSAEIEYERKVSVEDVVAIADQIASDYHSYVRGFPDGRILERDAEAKMKEYMLEHSEFAKQYSMVIQIMTMCGMYNRTVFKKALKRLELDGSLWATRDAWIDFWVEYYSSLYRLYHPNESKVMVGKLAEKMRVQMKQTADEVKDKIREAQAQIDKENKRIRELKQRALVDQLKLSKKEDSVVGERVRQVLS